MARDDSASTGSRALALPPWIPRPDALALTPPGAISERGGAWVHGLTPLLFLMAWVVALASGLASQREGAALLFPLAAIGVCCGVLPTARAARQRISANAAQALYRALWWLSPWLVLAWPLSCRFDADGGAGGALGTSVLLCSSFVLLPVLPITIELARRLSVRRLAIVAFRVSVGVLVVVLAASTWRSLTHPIDDAFGAYHRTVARFEPAPAAPGVLVAHTREGRLEQRRVGARCVTGFPGRPGVTHACTEPVIVYEWSGPRAPRAAFMRLDPPQYRGMVFVAVGGSLVGNVGAPQHMLFGAPLWEWIVGGALALAVALWTTRRTHRVLTAWRALPTRRGVARDGHAHCDDGTIVRLPSALAGYVGDVVVIGERRLAAAAFRDAAGRPPMVLPVGIAVWEAALADCEAIATSFALAVSWLPAAPLMAAPFLGMFA
ncbi:MAG: hypothetical protein KA978_15730 [Deltaproteobacteria bacterium]|nr:hypothetical protein [Deltaproteobacteria bacterium]MBP6832236.1 hypothetical protein [Deltaproteobacteria bacterium]